MDHNVDQMRAAEKQMNRLGKQKQPFLFVIDFEMKAPVILPLPLQDDRVLFDMGQWKHTGPEVDLPDSWTFQPSDVDRNAYALAFEQVQSHIHQGDSYLVNLTQSCPVATNLSLLQLFHLAKARYKLYFRDQFVVFSPETFLTITDGQISCYPMKGTIDARIPDAETILRNSEKETAEHMTMVDLIRNDLSRFAQQVRVKRCRYLDLITTSKGALWQMSSEICGMLPEHFPEQIGTFLFSMLPAGSVSGAPKKKTVEIIRAVEGHRRGYYTGVFGYFDGEQMNSAVMIRYLERTKNGLIYKSGGGVTAKSQLQAEYKEMIEKIYVPAG